MLRKTTIALFAVASVGMLAPSVASASIAGSTTTGADSRSVHLQWDKTTRTPTTATMIFVKQAGERENR